MLSSFIRRIMINLPFQQASPKNGGRKSVISIIGTTGVGKSQLSIELALKFNGEVINADSMQMYQGLEQITNKHPMEERYSVPHHVMNHVKWDEEYSVHRFKTEALQKINEIHDRGKIPIIVGGTHYYLQSLLFDNKTIGDELGEESQGKSKEQQEEEDKPTSTESKLTEEQLEILDGPVDALFEYIQRVDPKVAHKFHPNDGRRLRRALEVYFITGKPASEFYSEQKSKQSTDSSLRFETIFFWLYSDPKALDLRLGSRVDKMMTSGGLDEIKDLYTTFTSYETAPDLERGVWQVIGFKEFMPFLEASSLILNKENESIILKDPLFVSCVDEMKLRTSQYARKQIKWIKNTLSPALNKEGLHGWPKFGKLYLLDATDLGIWDQNVGARGAEICESFVTTGTVPVGIPQQPENMKEELVKPLSDESKDSFGEEKWKHYTCDICVDKDTGKPMVLVGDQYKIHVSGKKHKRSLLRGKRKREYEDWKNGSASAVGSNNNFKKEKTDSDQLDG